MKLFHWPSTFLSRKSPGTIVVMAETVEKAREKVRSDFDKMMKARNFGLLGPEERAKCVERCRQLMEKDLKNVPQTQDRIYVQGT